MQMYFALNTLRGTKTPNFNPKEVRRASPPLLVWESPPWAKVILEPWLFSVLSLYDYKQNTVDFDAPTSFDKYYVIS